MLLPPPPDVIRFRQALEQSSRAGAAANGYAVLVKSSDKNRVILKCDRGGTYRNRCYLTESTRRQKTASHLNGYKVELLRKKDRVLQDSHHNHDALLSRVAHPSLRNLDDAGKAQQESLTSANVAP